MKYRLRLTGRQHAKLLAHLFPGDGKEALAVALCGRRHSSLTTVLLMHDVVPIPYEACDRTAGCVRWPPPVLEPVLKQATDAGYSVLKLHSHPSGFRGFSALDNDSDQTVFESVYGWVDGPHASAVMLPDGEIFARVVLGNGEFVVIECVLTAGDDISLWFDQALDEELPEHSLRHRQLFGDATTQLLRRLRIAVVGCSGTGSPVVEQLARLGVAELVLVDPDRVERKNLNRIYGATMGDALDRRLKVEVLERSIRAMGLGTKVATFPTDLADHKALLAVADSDVVFGCMDSASGRNLLNRLCRYYLVPYIDVGVKLDAGGAGQIDEVAGGVHYLQPDGAELIDKGLFTREQVEAEDLAKANPAEYKERLERGYVRGVHVDRPAVISINTAFAGLAVTEFLARLHAFRLDPNATAASTRFSLAKRILSYEPDRELTPVKLKQVGSGDTVPLLGMPRLGPK